MPDQTEPDEPWYRWGKRVLYAEMGVAVLVTVFSLTMAFMGEAGYIA
ncbi:hypothetical protein [Halarchaeum sp. P4]